MTSTDTTASMKKRGTLEPTPGNTTKSEKRRVKNTRSVIIKNPNDTVSARKTTDHPALSDPVIGIKSPIESVIVIPIGNGIMIARETNIGTAKAMLREKETMVEFMIANAAHALQLLGAAIIYLTTSLHLQIREFHALVIDYELSHP